MHMSPTECQQRAITGRVYPSAHQPNAWQAQGCCSRFLSNRPNSKNNTKWKKKNRRKNKIIDKIARGVINYSCCVSCPVISPAPRRRYSSQSLAQNIPNDPLLPFFRTAVAEPRLRIRNQRIGEDSQAPPPPLLTAPLPQIVPPPQQLVPPLPTAPPLSTVPPLPRAA